MRLDIVSSFDRCVSEDLGRPDGDARQQDDDGSHGVGRQKRRWWGGGREVMLWGGEVRGFVGELYHEMDDRRMTKPMWSTESP